MTIVCEYCDGVFERESIMYGTHCPHCGKFIAPFDKPDFIKGQNTKKEILQKEMLEKMKRKFKETE